MTRRPAAAAALLVVAAAAATLTGTIGGRSTADYARPYRPAVERSPAATSTNYLICADGPRC
jgi:hypothetical protein